MVFPTSIDRVVEAYITFGEFVDFLREPRTLEEYQKFAFSRQKEAVPAAIGLATYFIRHPVATIQTLRVLNADE